MKPDIEGIKEYWKKVDPGCDDPEDVASKGMDHVPVLLSEVEALRAKLAAATEALGDMAANKSSLADGIRNLQQVCITNMGLVKTLEEKLALSEAAGAEMREALEFAKSSIEDPSNGGLNETMYKVFEKALASDHGKAYLEVVRAASKLRFALIASQSECDVFKAIHDARVELFDALDRLPGKGE